MTALSLLRVGRLASRSLAQSRSHPSSSICAVQLLLQRHAHHATAIPISQPTNVTATTHGTLLLSGPSSTCSHSSLLISRRSLATSANTLSLIKKLRSQSGAPIVDCKKALAATVENVDDNDEDAHLGAALDWLREHGAAKAASKVQGRESLQGLVALKINDDERTAALVKVASETDFAAQSDKFVKLVVQVADATLQVSAAAAPPSISSSTTGDNDEDLLIIKEIEKVQQQESGTTVKDLLDEAIVAIRENISIAQAQKLESDDDDDSLWVGYVHNRVDGSNAGTAAAVVQIGPAATDVSSSATTRDDLQSAGKKLAMHIVAAKPQFLSMESVPTDILDKEREMIQKQIVEQEESSESNEKKSKKKKPPEIIAKIAEGRLRKFLEQVCLMDQAHMIEEGNPKVSKILKQQGMVVKRFETMSIE